MIIFSAKWYIVPKIILKNIFYVLQSIMIMDWNNLITSLK